jgi:hypothetical protein
MRRLVLRFGSPGLGRNQIAKFTQRREVFRDQFLVFNPNTQVGFQKPNQTNQTEGVNPKRFVRIFNRGKWDPIVVDIVLQLLWYLHNLPRGVTDFAECSKFLKIIDPFFAERVRLGKLDRVRDLGEQSDLFVATATTADR